MFPYRLAAGLVAVAMFVCGFALWTAVPAGVMFALPHLVRDGVSLPLVLVAVLAAMLAMTKVVALLNALYCRLMAVPERGPAPDGWRRSVCEPTPERGKSLLETIVAASAIASVVTLVVWFLFFAHCGQGLCSV